MCERVMCDGVVCERVVCMCVRVCVVCDNVVSERVDREGADGTGRSRRSADGSAEHRCGENYEKLLAGFT